MEPRKRSKICQPNARSVSGDFVATAAAEGSEGGQVRVKQQPPFLVPLGNSCCVGWMDADC